VVLKNCELFAPATPPLTRISLVNNTFPVPFPVAKKLWPAAILPDGTEKLTPLIDVAAAVVPVPPVKL